jgi:Gti1/Pac2 family transcription factor
MRLVKQTYSAYIDGPKHSRKWHLSTLRPMLSVIRSSQGLLTSPLPECADAYYTQDTFDQMRTVDDYPDLRKVVVPTGMYTCARANNVKKARANRCSSTDDADGDDPSTPLFAKTITVHYRHRLSPYSGEVHLHPPPPYPTTHRQLAPLQYLQNITPPVRNPVDDEQLRALRHSISVLPGSNGTPYCLSDDGDDEVCVLLSWL